MTATAARPAARPLAVAVTVILAVVVSAVGTSLIALVASLAGVGAGFPPLQPQAYLSFAVVGTLAAIGGWVLVVRFVRRSARVLRVLVPVLVLLTLIPDAVLLATGFIPAATPGGVAALALMHPLVAAVAVLAGRRIAPAR
ncbi:DUF6069 family protein [Protaetiibacter intestinalis]|uniref:Uncharacterized protein n=1 Tax=Protaetiibacter intestinalis TaxID=2419774 RepID=A0A387B3P6_9MICO|nr:DUF6069 family protein [Protaetiibacter intestinalis]AYF97043.1 hypothetical protein D7I47_01440 [Protaetiibacter intestinalis]